MRGADRAPVSVIIPAYNGERYIRAAIASVQAQTLGVSEIIVVDDGSCDRTPEIARALGVTVLQETHRGVCATRNAGIRAAASDWIGFLDQDDIWDPRKIECQWAAVQRHPDAAVVSCYLRYLVDETVRSQLVDFDVDGGLAEEHDGCIAYSERGRHHLPFSRLIDCTSNLLIRRDILLSAGMFNLDLAQNEDLDCFLRVIARSPLAIVRRPLVLRRIHDSNASLRDPEGAVRAYDTIVAWLGAYPDRYPPGARRAYGKDAALRKVRAGRALLSRGQRAEARALLRQALTIAFTGRASLLWCLSFLTPALFGHLLSIRRAIVKSPNS
jgi:GT2 family glycosyltransferase